MIDKHQHITTKSDLSFSAAKAYFYNLIIIVPLLLTTLLVVIIFYVIWGETYVVADITIVGILKLIPIVLLGVMLHELIHGLSWIYFSKKSVDAIKFGFQLKTLTPYAHSSEPMKVTAYRLGVMMPGLLLGVFPCILGVIAGNEWVMFIGLFFIWSASGDALVLWSIRNVKSGQLVEDHPTRCGCCVIETQNE